MPDKIREFKNIFTAAQKNIASFPGCTGVTLMQDMECPEILFTYSTWVNMEQLEAYRQSALFRETWQKTKILFSGKPEAWSLVKQDIQ